MKTVIVGLGNPILGDDGVGWVIAEEVRKRLADSQSARRNLHAALPTLHSVEVDCVSLGGLSLMERLIGYNRAILIDTLNTSQAPVGTLSCIHLKDLPAHTTGHTTAAHDTSLHTALQVGRSLGAELPDEIIIIGVESPHIYDFSEELTPPVAQAVPGATQLVLDLLQPKEEHIP